MKKALLPLLIFWAMQPTPVYLLVHRDLKKPPAASQVFTPELYLQRYFPVYQSDVAAITAATNRAMQLVDSLEGYLDEDTVTAAHTTIYLKKDNAGTGGISVILITEVEETQTSFSFALVREETNTRKIKRRLLDFATNLNP